MADTVKSDDEIVLDSCIEQFWEKALKLCTSFILTPFYV